ncbi:MAG: efflux RND transporter periplasmic adaptor subunit [Gammaproteobacteria bacterium]|nr:efflux RND transporter periplasmic adaptor subunit [Gammaproteobacteria bacterium]
MRAWLGIAIVLAVGACDSEQPDSLAPLYDTVPVETRAIEVTVDAAGVIEPEVTVEVKSKASGEVLAIHAETGDVVEAGFLLVEIDQRTPRNRLAEAEASLVAAKARRTIAITQKERSQTLFATGTLTETDYEQSQLELANAQAQVIGMEVALENAKIAMDDTQIRAPITGTIIERHVEPGTVISSPTQDVGGGSILLKMADLRTVQVRTLVDETDIGKIRRGMSTRVTVAAYPNQPFDGEVLKIEPQAIVEQNVTMFAVLIRLDNDGELLKPGMNAEVEIRIANRESVSAVPTIALRAESDIPTAALMLGLAEAELREILAESAAVGSMARRNFTAQQPSAEPGSQLPGGAGGVDVEQIRSLIANRQSGAALTAQQQELVQQLQQRFGGGMNGGGRNGGDRDFGGGMGGDRPAAASAAPSVASYQFGGDYWVVTMQDGEPVPVSVRTGLTDFDYSEIVDGLDINARVLLLPSSSLFEQQELLQQLMTSRFSTSPFQTSGGGMGGGNFR